MLELLIGLFLILHGLVHLLYAGQSARVFELQTGLTWPDDSWALARLIGNDAIRTVAIAVFSLIAIGFVAGGVGIMLGESWWRPTTIAAAVLGTVSALMFWDGHLEHLPDKGGIGLLISAGILVSLLVVDWPQVTV